MADLNRYYKVLGIRVGSSQAEVKQAYRKLAKLWHPDRFAGDPVLQQQAEEKLKTINEAYRQLKDYQPPEPAPKKSPPRPAQATSSGVSAKLTNAEKCYERASEYGRAGQYKEALEELSLAIRLNPNYAQAYRYRGFVHSMLGFELGAEADLRKARDLDWEQAYAARRAKQTEKSTPNPSSRPSRSSDGSAERSPNVAHGGSPPPSSPPPPTSPSPSPPSPPPTWTCLQTLTDHQDGVTTIALSGDGKFLASGSRDRTIKLWNLRTGKAFCTLSGHTAAVSAIALSADGTLLVSSSEDQTLRFWHVQSGTLLRTLTGYGEVFTDLALSADRHLLVGCGQTGLVHFWRLDTNPITHGLYDHKATIVAIALSRDGQQLISGSSNHLIELYQGRTGELLRDWAAHSMVITAIALNPIHQSFAAAGEDGLIQWWADPSTYANQASHLLSGHSSTITALSFTGDGQFLVSGSRDRTLRLWDPRTGKELSTLTGHTEAITSVATSADGHLIVSGSLDRTIKLWNRSQQR